MKLKKHTFRITRLALIGLSVLLTSATWAQGFSPAEVLRDKARTALVQNPNLPYNPYTVIVKYDRHTTENQKSFVRSQVTGYELASTKHIKGFEVLGTSIGVEKAIDRLNRMPWVEYAELDYTVHADVIPNDTHFGVMWGLHNTGQSAGVVDADIDAPEAWDIFTGSSSVNVAVIDTGVLRTHPDLVGNTWINTDEIAGDLLDNDFNGYVDDVYGWDFVNNDNDPIDDHGHGTHCAGTIGASGNNGAGVTGINWAVKIASLKFLSAAGSGSTSGAVLAVDYCAANGIKISNNSWGGGGFTQSLFDAINNAAAMGHIFIAAAGNSGVDNDLTPHYPSSYNLDNLIAVAAIDRFDAKSSFSSYGLTSVDLGAPGTDIASTYTGNSYVYLSGTSMATPHVTGAVALLSGFKPAWTWQQVRDGILTTVRPTVAMTGVTVTGGVLNIHAMLLAAQGPGNTAPTVNISSPADPTTVVVGTNVSFAGTANDTEDGDLTGSMSWSSNINGAIGAGGSFSTTGLSVGTHTITASATDSGSLSGSDTVTVTVNPANTAPVVTISSPANGSSFVQGTNVTFTGSATDTQQGNMSASLGWTSNINGSIGSGASFSTSTLSIGVHTITASVTDAGSLTGSAIITVTITAPVVTIPNAPSNLLGSKQPGGIARLTWNDNSNNETGFTIERQTRINNNTWGATTTFTVGANTTLFSQTPGVGRFRYRVRAFNGAGASAWTGYVNIKI